MGDAHEHKPCPFCGVRWAVSVVSRSQVSVAASCDDCGAQGPAVNTGPNDLDSAYEAWDERRRARREG